MECKTRKNDSVREQKEYKGKATERAHDGVTCCQRREAGVQKHFSSALELIWWNDYIVRHFYEHYYGGLRRFPLMLLDYCDERICIMSAVLPLGLMVLMTIMVSSYSIDGYSWWCKLSCLLVDKGFSFDFYCWWIRWTDNLSSFTYYDGCDADQTMWLPCNLMSVWWTTGDLVFHKPLLVIWT